MTVQELQQQNTLNGPENALKNSTTPNEPSTEGPETDEIIEQVPIPAINIGNIRIEQQYDILDGKETWCEGEVVTILFLFH